MRITKVEPLVCYGGRSYMNLVFAKVVTDDGIIGYGEGTEGLGTPVIMKALEDCARVVVGEDPFNLEYIWQKMYVSRWARGRSEHCAMATIETALWDIVGKATGQPVYNLLGGKVREKIRLYSHITTPDDSDESIIERAKDIKNAGFKMAKTHPYLAYRPAINRTLETSALDRTIQKVRVIRETAGEKFDLGIDCHNLFDLPTSIRLAKALEPFNLYWIEDPIDQEESEESYRRLREAIRVPIATGENLFTIWAFKDLLERSGVDMILPDVAHIGLMHSKKIAAVAEAYHVPLLPHNPNGPLGTLISAHLCSTIPNFVALEFVHPDVPWRDKLLTEPLRVKDGFLELPTKPGLGADLVEDEIAKHPYEEHRNPAVFLTREPGSPGASI